jgi:WD40 repeat protein
MLELKGHTQRVRALEFSFDGTLLASCAGSASTVWIWDLSTGTRLRQLRCMDRLRTLAFAPHSTTLATGQANGRVRVWNIETGQLLHALLLPPELGYSEAVSSLTFSPDGQTLAFPGMHPKRRYQGCIRRLDLASGVERELILRPYYDYLCRAAYSPDGRTLAQTGAHQVALLDSNTGAEYGLLKLHAQIPWSLAWSPDSGSLAVCVGWSVELWDVRTCTMRHLLKGHRDTAWAVAFSPDGRTVLSASSDQTVRLWDAATGRERTAFNWEIGKIQAVAFSPDGTRAAAGGESGSILIWDVDL